MDKPREMGVSQCIGIERRTDLEQDKRAIQQLSRGGQRQEDERGVKQQLEPAELPVVR